MATKKLDPDGIHRWIAKISDKVKYPHVLEGVNDDDCAILQLGQHKLVLTTDYLNANPIAKELGISSNWDLGRLLVAANLSDLCGTGAKPIAMLISLMFEKNTSEKDFKDFVKGVKFELAKHKIPLIGGDTKLGKSNSFCGTAIGIGTPKTKLYPKNGAKVGDLIWVSGEIGSISAAVAGLTKYKLNKAWIKWAKNVLVNPDLPLQKALNIAEAKIGNGGTDISDGLGENLYDLCDSSGVGAHIFAERLPLNKKCIELAKFSNIPPWVYAFNIGGDFQYIVTGLKRHKKRFESFGLYNIGIITSKKDKILILNKKNNIKLPRLGHTDLGIQNFAKEVDLLIQNTLSLANDY